MKHPSVSSYKSAPLFEHMEPRRLMSMSANLVPVTISDAAKTADPTLANDKSFDLQITVTAGDDFLAADGKFVLSSGTFYVPPQANSDKVQQNLWPLAANLEFDTFVSAPNFKQPIILGSFSPTTPAAVFSSTETNVSWGTPIPTPVLSAGTYTIGRFTVPSTATGTFRGQITSRSTGSNNPLQYSFSIRNGVVTDPNAPFITGMVYADTNANGKKDSTEAGLPGVKVFLDKNNNGALDSGEKTRLTDSNGNYVFDPLTAGTYYIRQILPSGYRRTQPSKDVYVCALKSGVNGTGKVFGDTKKVLISGGVFYDNDSDGHKDSNDTLPLSGWTIFIDTDKDGVLDAGETSTTSDANGAWSFKKLNAGTYLVRIAKKTGYKVTTASSFSVTLASGKTSTGHAFGAHKKA